MSSSGWRPSCRWRALCPGGSFRPARCRARRCASRPPWSGTSYRPVRGDGGQAFGGVDDDGGVEVTEVVLDEFLDGHASALLRKILRAHRRTACRTFKCGSGKSPPRSNRNSARSKECRTHPCCACSVSESRAYRGSRALSARTARVQIPATDLASRNFAAVDHSFRLRAAKSAAPRRVRPLPTAPRRASIRSAKSTSPQRQNLGKGRSQAFSSSAWRRNRFLAVAMRGGDGRFARVHASGDELSIDNPAPYDGIAGREDSCRRGIPESPPPNRERRRYRAPPHAARLAHFVVAHAENFSGEDDLAAESLAAPLGHGASSMRDDDCISSGSVYGVREAKATRSRSVCLSANKADVAACPCCCTPGDLVEDLRAALREEPSRGNHLRRPARYRSAAASQANAAPDG